MPPVTGDRGSNAKLGGISDNGEPASSAVCVGYQRFGKVEIGRLRRKLAKVEQERDEALQRLREAEAALSDIERRANQMACVVQALRKRFNTE